MCCQSIAATDFTLHEYVHELTKNKHCVKISLNSNALLDVIVFLKKYL